MQIKKIDISKKAADFIMELQPKQSKQNFAAILKLAQHSRPHDARKLQGYAALYRIDVGEYRIVYRTDEENVYILLIGKRNDDEVYKQLERIY